MLSSVSHDLRTPIAALQAAVEALADGIAPDPQRYLSSMQRDIDALTSLVDDLFLLVRLDSGRYEMPATSVDLTEIADEAIEALSPMADDRDIRLVLDAPGGVRVDGNAAALGRVIRNLLDNAIRHAPDGSTVDVIVEAESPRVRVIRRGPRVPVELRRPRLRALHPGRLEPQPRHRRRRPRTGHRPRRGRGPRRSHLDRGSPRGPRRLRAARRLTGLRRLRGSPDDLGEPGGGEMLVARLGGGLDRPGGDWLC